MIKEFPLNEETEIITAERGRIVIGNNKTDQLFIITPTIITGEIKETHEDITCLTFEIDERLNLNAMRSITSGIYCNDKELSNGEVFDFLCSQNEALTKQKKLLDLIADAYTFTKHDSVKEILRHTIYGLDTVAEHSAGAWNEYVILSNFFERQYGEHWDNFDNILTSQKEEETPIDDKPNKIYEVWYRFYDGTQANLGGYTKKIHTYLNKKHAEKEVEQLNSDPDLHGEHPYWVKEVELDD